MKPPSSAEEEPVEANDADLKVLAGKMLPVVQTHLKLEACGRPRGWHGEEIGSVKVNRGEGSTPAVVSAQ